MADVTAAGEPCSGMDDAQPVLCHQYGTNASQSFEMVKVPTPSLPAVVQVLFVSAVVDVPSVLAAIMFGRGTSSEVMTRIAAPMVGGPVTAPLLSMLVIPAAWYLIQ